MSNLFNSFQLKNLALKNRLMRSATTSYWSDEEGVLTDPILTFYKKLAKGGVGLIVKGHSYISEKGKAHTGQSGLASEKHIPRMKELTDLVHSFDTFILAQINHGGYACKADRITASDYQTARWEARGATPEDIQGIIEDFAHSAEIALQAGFDGIQIHAAHGYLISQFLSDRVNKREDNYGGSLKNRARLLLDAYAAIRKKVGNQPIIGVKLNCDDFAAEGGHQLEDAIQVALWLKEGGIDFIEISGGGPEQVAEIRKKRGRAEEGSGIEEATFSGHAVKIRSKVQSLPLALVDGIRSKQAMENLLGGNIVDLISMSKPFIIEPDLPQKMANGQERSSCIGCRKCLSREVFGKMMLRCHTLYPEKE